MLRRLWNAMSKFEKGVWISLVAISLFALLPGSLGPFEGVGLLQCDELAPDLDRRQTGHPSDERFLTGNFPRPLGDLCHTPAAPRNKPARSTSLVEEFTIVVLFPVDSGPEGSEGDA